MANRLLIYGSGGHAKVACSVAQAIGMTVVAFIDPYEENRKDLFGVPILPSAPEPLLSRFIAIGNNRIRLTQAEQEKANFATLIHPSAIVHETVQINPGVLICAGAIVQPDCIIGAHAIVNTAASIDHDSTLGDFAHLCPGARLAGGVTVGKGALIGTGAAVIPCMQIGEWATVGAGAAVVQNVKAETTVAGVPAKPI